MVFQSTPSPKRETKSAGVLQGCPKFQSTPSPKRETSSVRLFFRLPSISIHSLPKEGDKESVGKIAESFDFNPLPPQRGRLIQPAIFAFVTVFQSTPSPKRETMKFFELLKRVFKFQSTPSPKRETKLWMSDYKALMISIHSLPKEGDWGELWNDTFKVNFNPLPPQRGRHKGAWEV